MSENNTFGERVKELRRERGLSQSQMAEEIKAQYPQSRISQTSLSALELREETPRGNVIGILASYFGVDISEFYNGNWVAVTGAHCPSCRSRLLDVYFVEANNMLDFARTGLVKSADTVLYCSKCQVIFWDQPPANRKDVSDE